MHNHRLKLNRALEHLNAIHAVVKPWGEVDPCEVFAVSEVNSHKQTWQLKVMEAPPLDRVALLAGDTLHNLRQSIDYLAHSIARKLRKAEPPDNTHFPITNDPNTFEGNLANLAPPRIIPPDMRDILRRIQPFNRGPYILLDALKQMHDFDKHREAIVIGGGGVHQRTDLNSMQFDRVEKFAAGVSGFVEDDDEIFGFTGDLTPDTYFNVDFKVAPAVLFGPGTPVIPKQPVYEMRELLVVEVIGPLEVFL